MQSLRGKLLRPSLLFWGALGGIACPACSNERERRPAGVRELGEVFTSPGELRQEEGFLLVEDAGGRFLIDPRTLELRWEAEEGSPGFVVSEPVLAEHHFAVRGASVFYPERRLTVEIRRHRGRLILSFSSEIPQELPWPKVPLHNADHLILPHHEGHYVPVGDDDWRSHLTRSPWNTTEHLTLPFRGRETGGWMITYQFENPFHNRIRFAAEGTGLTLEFSHRFPPNRDVDKLQIFYLYRDRTATPITPALHFRRWLEQSARLVTLEEKMETAPPLRQLIGAPHAYVWDASSISRHDFRPGGWRDAAVTLVEAAARGTPSSVADWWENLDREHRRIVTEVAKHGAGGRYARRLAAEAVSRLESRDPQFVRAALGKYLLSPEQWGDGVSRKFIDRLVELGVTRCLLVAEGREAAERRPEIAAYARRQGFVFGVYDSFHSIHDPRTAGTDQSWPTAQFPPELYPDGAIAGPDGRPLRGFRGIGFKLSPVAARPFVEARVRRNCERVAYSYYFVDTDAFGEFYDDDQSGRKVTQREDAEARIARIRWIFESFRIPVGSEGGFYRFAPVLTVAEGFFLPVIGWGDPEMKDPQSKYFVGRYYPPDEPEIFFRSTELKPEYVKLHVDPRYRVPLYEAVFHDSVITSSHWSAPNLKFSNVADTVALLEFFYQVPSLYHLNLETLPVAGAIIAREFRDFAETHAYSYRHSLEEFAFLTADRLVQRARFGELQLVANFADDDYGGEDWFVPAHSVAWRLGGREGLWTPSDP